MSDTTFSEYSTNDEGRASAQRPSRTRPRTRPQPQVEETYEEAYDSYEDGYDYEEPVGLFSTPGRTLALVGAIVLLLAIGIGIAWELGASSAPQSPGPSAAVSVGPRTGLLAPSFSLVDVQT